jgi:hypothetical protein
LTDQAAFQFGDRSKDRENHFSGRRRRIDVFSQADESDAQGVECFQRAKQMRNRAGEAIEFPNRDRIKAAPMCIGDQPVELGIRRDDGAVYQPRMHDLRYTFAVHRIAAWFEQGADLNHMLLAAYIGQAGLGSTERYLSLTPERFRTQLIKLSPLRPRKKRWRDDATLMKFLAEL